MRKVELVEGIQSSVLGFGCAPILGSQDKKTSSRALEMAFDFGITHFDIARSYGYGEAENFVGKVFKGKRNKLVLASKFGIVANWKASLFRPVKPIFRVLRNSKKKKGHLKLVSREVKNSLGNLFINRIEVNSVQMCKNLERSLKALKTDFLDYLLIHEPLCSIENIDELYETAHRLKDEGKIRAWGLAFMKDQFLLHQAYLHKFDILQFNNSTCDSKYSSFFEGRVNKANILFSPLNDGTEIINPKEKLEKLFNEYSKSVILCSMYNEKHLKENVQIASK